MARRTALLQAANRPTENAVAEAQARPDIDTLLKDPGRHFRSPHEVVTAAGFTREEKRRILDSWALDARLLEVAEEENMGGGDRPGLREVKLALLELGRDA
jgi:hypothetical protein